MLTNLRPIKPFVPKVHLRPYSQLDTDIALVRNLSTTTNMDPTTGKVSCNFVGSTNLCPLRTTWQDAADFAGDNDLWLVRGNQEHHLTLEISLTDRFRASRVNRVSSGLRLTCC